MAAALRHRLSDRLAVTDSGRMRLGGDAKTRGEALGRDPQMHFALPPQHDLAGLVIVHDDKRRILVDEFMQREAELYVVFPLPARRSSSAITGGGGASGASCAAGFFALVSVSPVATGSSLPSATVSPDFPGPRFLGIRAHLA